MRWLLLKDLQLLRRSPLVTALLVIYPIVLAVLIGLAISRSPEKPRVAFLNQIPKSTGLSLGDTGGFSQEEARSRLCAKIECVTASSRAEVEQKVKDGDVLGGLILPPDFLSKLQGELTTNSSEPATVEVLVNQDDPLKAQIVDDRISSLLTQANLLLSTKITDVAVNYEQLLANGGEFEIPFLNQTVHILGLAALRADPPLRAEHPAAGAARPGRPGDRLRAPRAPEPRAREPAALLDPPADRGRQAGDRRQHPAARHLRRRGRRRGHAAVRHRAARLGLAGARA